MNKVRNFHILFFVFIPAGRKNKDNFTPSIKITIYEGVAG